jgi:CheY-like chemotaxis protein
MAKKLLVVDQNLAVHRLLDFTLSKEGFEIVAVEDGLAALDRAYQDAPALIMVSSQLDGLPLSMFVKKVRERETLRATPIILMAQSSDDLNMEQLRRSGITDVVKKPLDAMEINATIHRCIPPAAPVAVGAREPAGAAVMDGMTPNSSHSGSTEDDQDMMQMEQLLGWVPREQAGQSAQSAAQSAAHPAPSPPPTPPPPEPQTPDAPLEFELYDPMAEAVAATPQENAASQNNVASMDDLLLTGSDALQYQPPVVELPPPPPPPEPEPEPESELQELMSAQAPIPVRASEHAASRPPAASARAPQPTPPDDAGGPEEMTREETERLVRSMVEEMTRKLAQETVEQITKELVPELTERAVRAEIERLKAESSAAD